MENCSRCEVLPDNPSGTGKIFLSSPLQHTLKKLSNIFENNDHPFNKKDDEIIYSKLTVEGLKTLGEIIRDELSDDELSDVKALWKDSGNELTLTDLTEMKSLKTFLGQLESEWLVELLDDDRLYNVLQPIVVADNPDEIHGYEALIRGRDKDGNTIGPGELFPTARQSDMLFQLDREARITAVESSQDFGVNRKIFINFMPTSIYDPEYCLRTTMEAVKENDIRSEQLVFEVVETEEIEDRENLLDILNHYRNEGINVALDDLGAGYSSLSILNDLKPDYVKLDLELVQSVNESPLQAELASSIINAANENGIVTLAEGIETEEEFKWFRDHNVDLAQGYYFSKPTESPTKSIDLD